MQYLKMDNLRYTVSFTNQFKRDYKKMIKRGMKISLLDEVIASLARGEVLDKKYKDHALIGEFEGFRECHIKPDWLLMYKIKDDQLILSLTRTGTHNDLFSK